MSNMEVQGNTTENIRQTLQAADRPLMIDVRDVSKVYQLYDKPINRLKESVSLTHKCYHRDFYALNRISFQVRKGESVGIIGTNGSGKSTMLKIVTGVLTPTCGNAEVTGTVCALLELGAGFNQDYTGIENIYMNGTMMGFTKEQMDGKLKEILDFADIGDFVYQPVKNYSSGMFVRLAFALNIAVDPEILIVDEALSVGDVFFQAKCYHRMDELKRKGTTILMVTHDLGSVMKYCDRVILLNKGEKVSEGKPGEMVDLYKKILAGQYDPSDNAASFIEGQDFGVDTVGGEAMRDKAGDKEGGEAETGTAGTGAAAGAAGTGASGNNGTDASGNAGNQVNTAGAAAAEGEMLMQSKLNLNPFVKHYGNGKAELYDFGILDHKGKISNVVLKGEQFSIKERIRFRDQIESPIFTFTIKDKRGLDLSGTNTMFEGKEIRPVKAGDEYVCTFTQKMTLQGGEYLLSMSCTGFEQGEHVVYDRKYDAASITVLSNKNTVGIFDMESAVTLERHEA